MAEVGAGSRLDTGHSGQASQHCMRKNSKKYNKRTGHEPYK